MRDLFFNGVCEQIFDYVNSVLRNKFILPSIFWIM